MGKSAFKATKGQDGVAIYVSGITYHQDEIRERDLVLYKSNVLTSTTFIPSEWDVVGGATPVGSINTIQMSSGANELISDEDFTWASNILDLGKQTGYAQIGNINPIYRFYSDTDTGIGRNGGDTLSIYTGNFIGLQVKSSTGATNLHINTDNVNNNRGGDGGIEIAAAITIPTDTVGGGSGVLFVDPVDDTPKWIYSGGTMPLVGGGIIGATNGLSINGFDVILGGTLTNNTTIDTASFGVGIGNNTQATGTDSIATNIGGAYGACSFAMNSGNAYGDFSHAEGYNTVASGHSSHSEGYNTTASGNSAHAQGYNTTASGHSAHAQGYSTVACGHSSHAEGNLTCAINNISHAEGYRTCSFGDSSHAEGKLTCTCGSSSHAEGYRTTTFGDSSHAEGNRTFACGSASHSGGYGIITKEVCAVGSASFNHSFNGGAQTVGHGAMANNSAILGGCNHNIESGNVRAAIIGGNAIKLTGTSYIDTTAVSKLALMDTPTSGASTQILARNTSTGVVEYTTVSGGSGGNPSSYATLTDSPSIIYDFADDYFATKALTATTTGITLTVQNIIAGANQILTIVKNTADNVVLTLSGATFYGYTADVDYETTPEVVLSGASGNIYDLSFLARTATCIGVAIGDIDGTSSGGASSWLALSDTDPTNYSGQGGKGVRVNAGQDGLEFYTLTGGTNSYVTGMTFNTGTGLLSLERNDALPNVTKNLDNRYSLTGHTHTGGTDANYYLTGLSFDTGTGILTGNVSGATNPTVDLDDRYSLTGHTHTKSQIIDFSETDYWKISGTTFLSGNTIIDSGNNGVSIGKNAISSGQTSFATGENTSAIGSKSHAEGDTTFACGISSHAEGYYTYANGDGSHAEGSITFAEGAYSHAEGWRSIASGHSSHAEGYKSCACGVYSHAEGCCSTAHSCFSHAEGKCGQSCGYASHAEGFLTIARGVYSHAEGRYSESCGYASHAEGKSTQACGLYSHSQGAYTHTRGACSFSSGVGRNSGGLCIIADGIAGFNHSQNTAAQTVGHGTLADNSTILGGINHNIETGNTGATIIGGNTIKLTGTTYVDTTAVGNLAIISIPTSGASTQILARNETTGVIEYTHSSGFTGGGVTNWIDLDDTDPTGYTGQGGKGVRVNAGQDGLEFYTIAGGANSYVSGMTFNSGSGLLTLTRTDGLPDVIEDLDGRYLTGSTDTNYYLTGLSFDTGTGILTGNVSGATNPTVDLDDRYSLTGHTHTGLTTGHTHSESMVMAVSDETTDLTSGATKLTFRMPYAFTITDVRASVSTAPSGSTIIVDINEGGASILSTLITIDSNEKTSTTAATPPALSDTALADDAEITMDIDQIGSTTAGAGLKVTLIGYK